MRVATDTKTFRPPQSSEPGELTPAARQRLARVLAQGLAAWWLGKSDAAD